MPLKRLQLSDWIVVFLSIVVLLSSIFYFHQARGWIDREFPGYLTFENHVVGAFNQFEWEGTRRGLKYHDLIRDHPLPDPLPFLLRPPGFGGQAREGGYLVEVASGNQVRQISILPMIFTLGDFLKVFCIPFFSGFLFLVFAVAIYWIMRGQAGALPFALFNAGVAHYLMASFDFHTDYHATSLFLLNFAFLPAFMTHFALVYPEMPASIQRRKWLIAIPYLVSAALSVPYLYSFHRHPQTWPFWEGVVIAYAAFSYLFWIGRLGHISNSPRHEMNRVTAKYLLGGQLLAFVVPLILAIYIFLFKGEVPLNWVAPANLIFPIAALFGMTLGRLKRTQMELIQSEKMASLGQLLAGVAHEINNPTTFIYSNLAPLKDYISYLKGAVKADVPKYRGEMPVTEVLADLEALTKNIEEGAQRTKQIVADLRSFGHSQDEAITDVSILQGIQSTLNILGHQWKDRIRIHVDCPENLTVRANPGQLSQVWMNLLTNAIQAINGEGEISVTGKKEKDSIVISIKDTGCGIAPGDLKRIFDPFFTTKEQGEGTGLGLSIVQQIVKKFGGTIDVKSEVGKGTEFILLFP